MGMFGGKKPRPYDGPAAAPLAFENAAPIAPMGAMPDLTAGVAPVQQKKPGFFGQGGFGRYLAGAFGDSLAHNAGMGTPFMDAMQQRAKQDYEDDLYKRRGADDWSKFVRQHDYEAAHPKPAAPTEFERILESGNYTPEERQQLLRQYAQQRAAGDPIVQTNADGTKTLYPRAMLYGGQPNGALPAIGSVVPDPRKGGAGPQTPRNFP